MNLLIPYRADRNGGLELKYCIRSMVKHFKDMTGVVVVGDRPEWYIGDHIQSDQIKIRKRKEYQIFSKLIQAEGINLVCSDDVYALKDFDATLPDMYSMNCHRVVVRKRYRVYRDMYKRCPPDWLNFDIHQPMVMDIDKLRTLDFSEDRPIKTYYANMFPKENQRPSVDGKIKEDKPVEYIREFIEHRFFFSSHDNAHTTGMQKVLNELYPLPSQYER